MMVCYHCGQPKELESETPGVRKYKPCSNCGQIGMRDDNDRYQELHRKKSLRAPYEASPYRGGKLTPRPGAEKPEVA